MTQQIKKGLIKNSFYSLKKIVIFSFILVMKKIIITTFIAVLLSSCKQNVTTADIAKINGYWEIEKAILPGGEKKDYKINEAIDYFEIKDKKGFRKKVYPQLDGKYLVNDLQENVSISDSSGIYFVNYKTDYAKWKEQIIEIHDSILVLKNKANLEYHYKKPIPFSLK